MRKNFRASSAFAALACAMAVTASTFPGFAATGTAWDQVTKISMDGSVPAPNFTADFQKASQPPPAMPKLPFGMGGSQMAAARSAMAMQSGLAEHHFVAGNLSRTDDVGAQTATVVDCTARTYTYLDLAKKTYRVEPFDKPAAPPAGGPPGRSGAPPSAQDDGSRTQISYTASLLGPKQIDGAATDGYKATMTMTTTRPGGETHTVNTDMTAYYANQATPPNPCPQALFAGGGMMMAGPMAAMGNSMGMLRSMNFKDSRFTFTANGPALPVGRLDLFSLYQIQPEQGGNGRSFGMVVERGNVHSIVDTDQSIFGIPAGFTKEG